MDGGGRTKFGTRVERAGGRARQRKTGPHPRPLVPDAALDNCSCIVLPSPIHGLVPPPSLEACPSPAGRRDRVTVDVHYLLFSSVKHSGIAPSNQGAIRWHALDFAHIPPCRAVTL